MTILLLQKGKKSIYQRQWDDEEKKEIA